MKINYSQVLDNPIQDVFTCMTNFENLDSVLSAVVSSTVTTPGPIKVGSVYQETRKMFGKDHTEQMEVVELIPNQRLVLLAQPGSTTYETTYRFIPVGEKTKVEIEFKASTTNILAKIMMPLMSMTMKKMMKKCFQDDLTEIEAHLKKSL